MLRDSFLQLVRLGIGSETVSGFKFQDSSDWEGIKALAEKQGLSAVVLDGIEQLPDQQRPPKVFLLEWIGETLQGYEYRYDLYCKAIAELAGFYNSHGFRMMVLKGYACSLDWPKPEHRPCGDIDIWLFGKYKEVDSMMAKEKGIEIDNGHHHHTVFYWRDFMVENHYDFINIHHHKSHKALEMILNEQGMDDTHYDELYGERIYLPSPNLYAVFLLKHLMLHFASGEISLRQVLDWAFFIKKHNDEIDWEWFHSLLDEFHMVEFYNIINAICVEDLGFDANIFKGVQFNPYLRDRVIGDIFTPEFPNEKLNNLFKRVIWKIRRWKSNEWKHKLCYAESMWSAFWFGVWNHIIKPSSI